MSGLRVLARLLLPLLTVPVMTASAEPQVQLDPAEARPGDSITVTGSGFDSCLPRHTVTPGDDTGPTGPDTDTPTSTSVKISAEYRKPGERDALGTAQLDDTGGFTMTVQVPRDAEAGQIFNVWASCRDQRPHSRGDVAESELLTVVAPVTDSPVPTDSSSSGGGSGSSSGGDSSAATTGSSATETGNGGSPPPVLRAPSLPSLPVPIGVLAAGVVALGLAAFATRAVRRARVSSAATRPRHPPRKPMIDAVSVAGPPAAVVLRRTGSGRSAAIRVVPHGDPGVRVVQPIGDR